MNWTLKLALMKDGRGAWRVGQEAGLSPSVISRIVTGRRPASRREREAIAEVLGVDERELFPAGDQRARVVAIGTDAE